MRFLRVGVLILLLLAGWASVRAEPGLAGVLSGCTVGRSDDAALTRAAPPPRPT